VEKQLDEIGTKGGGMRLATDGGEMKEEEEEQQ